MNIFNEPIIRLRKLGQYNFVAKTKHDENLLRANRLDVYMCQANAIKISADGRFAHKSLLTRINASMGLKRNIQRTRKRERERGNEIRLYSSISRLHLTVDEKTIFNPR